MLDLLNDLSNDTDLTACNLTHYDMRNDPSNIIVKNPEKYLSARQQLIDEVYGSARAQFDEGPQ